MVVSGIGVCVVVVADLDLSRGQEIALGNVRGKRGVKVENNIFAKYPIYLKASDVMDMLQVCKSKAYELMRMSGAMPDLGKTKRVHRDKFIAWLMDSEKQLTK